jgi:excinuclease ABC subunit B
VAVTDADKEGFLRSERSLIQTIGRAARNVNGRVILYGDHVTDSMAKAISETERRRVIQAEYNKEHGIEPQTIVKKIARRLAEVYGFDILSEETDRPLLPAKTLEAIRKAPDKIEKEIDKLKKKMRQASNDLEFEAAAQIRDEIKRLQMMQLTLASQDDALESNE